MDLHKWTAVKSFVTEKNIIEWTLYDFENANHDNFCVTWLLITQHNLDPPYNVFNIHFNYPFIFIALNLHLQWCGEKTRFLLNFYNELRKYPPFLIHENFMNTLSEEQLSEISVKYFDFFMVYKYDFDWEETARKIPVFDYYYSPKFNNLKTNIDKFVFCDFWTDDTTKQFLLFIMKKQKTRLLRKLFTDAMHECYYNNFCKNKQNITVYVVFAIT